MATSLPNPPFFSLEGSIAGHTWQTCSWPREFVLDVSITRMFFPIHYLFMSTCVHQSVCWSGHQYNGFCGISSFLHQFGLVQSPQMPYLSQLETLLAPEVPNSQSRGRTKPLSDRWYKVQISKLSSLFCLVLFLSTYWRPLRALRGQFVSLQRCKVRMCVSNAIPWQSFFSS